MQKKIADFEHSTFRVGLAREALFSNMQKNNLCNF